MKGPVIDWAALSPLVALTGGLCIVLLVGLFRSTFVRRGLVPAMTLVCLGVTAGLCVWQWDDGNGKPIIEGALAADNLRVARTFVFLAAGIGTVFLSWRSSATEEAGEGEYFALLLTSILGMVVLV